MRLFVAIPLAAETEGELRQLVAGLERPDDGLRWSTPESWQITLQFLGTADDDQFACLKSGLQQIRWPCFPVQLADFGFFDRAGAFFVDVPPTPELAGLQQQVTAATRPCGFEPEERAYHPHITLARNKGRSSGIRNLKPRLGPTPALRPFPAREFLLYESFLSTKGSRYEILQRVPLS